MIKEIAVVTNEPKYTCVVTNPTIVLDERSLSATMVQVEPDTFVDDDYKADWKLVDDIKNICQTNNNIETMAIRRTLPPNTSKVNHYTNIMEEAHEVAKMRIFMNTKRFMPNFIIASSDISPVLVFNADNYKRNNDRPYEGTVVWGWYKDIPVLISPMMNSGELIFGVNNDTTPGVVSFTKDDKVCHKILNPSHFVMLKLED